MKKQISPLVGVLVVLAAIGIALGVMWVASEAPIADKPSVPFWLREGGTGGGPPGPPAGPPAPKTQAGTETPAKRNAQPASSPTKEAGSEREPVAKRAPSSK